MNKPIAVIISDIHYELSTLKVADAATRLAIAKANELSVPLAIAGDMHNSKANMRGECVNQILETIRLCDYEPIILVGNHSRLNEKAPAHALNFLKPLAKVIETPTKHRDLGWLVPYHSELELPGLRAFLKTLQPGTQLIMHQGLINANSGEYFKDTSALNHGDVAGLRVISGHYHNRQTISLPDGGVWDFIGNPYTLTFAEANDPEKGYKILYDDGSLEFVPTNLRKHVVINIKMGEPKFPTNIDPRDIVKVKITGTMEQLAPITKKTTARELGVIQPYQLELIPILSTDDPTPKNQSQDSLLDSLIDLTNVTQECKVRIKALWRNITG